MAVKHGSSKKGIYKTLFSLRGKYKGKYFGPTRKPTIFRELKQLRSWMN